MTIKGILYNLAGLAVTLLILAMLVLLTDHVAHVGP